MRKYFHVIPLPFPLEKLRFLAFAVGRSASSTLQVYLFLSKLQNYVHTYENISDMSAPTSIPALDEASKVRPFFKKT